MQKKRMTVKEKTQVKNDISGLYLNAVSRSIPLGFTVL